MSARGKLMVFFPALHLGLCLVGVIWWIESRNLWWLLWILGFLYLFPPLIYRLHQMFWPVNEGRLRLDTTEYSPWWGSLQLQGVFNAAPFLEACLRLIPGCYSAWLRLWGSRIGRSVFWTPRVEITDRSFLDVGDNVIFGHRVALYAHVVDKTERRTILYLKSIRIGSGAFIGAGSRLGPGASVGEGARIPILTDVYIGEIKEGGSQP